MVIVFKSLVGYWYNFIIITSEMTQSCLSSCPLPLLYQLSHTPAYLAMYLP